VAHRLLTHDGSHNRFHSGQRPCRLRNKRH
jgi:hypothetical protein